LVVIDLTPQYQGYCANLARTFVIGPPNQSQRTLLTTYREIHETTRMLLKPGTKVSALDKVGKEICERQGLAEHHINGISHGIGLRFEETPASTIIPAHRGIALKENMTVTVGHTILAVPGVGGVRFEDVCCVTNDGGTVLHPYPVDWVV
jgi:Xaa-Pro aminopeptidase